MKQSLSLLLVAVPSILAMTKLGNQKVNAANSLRHTQKEPISKPQSARLDDESFIEVVGPPIIQESATVEVFFRANKVINVY